MNDSVKKPGRPTGGEYEEKVIVYLDKDMADRLKLEARKRKDSKSALIRRVLSDWLGGLGNE